MRSTYSERAAVNGKKRKADDDEPPAEDPSAPKKKKPTQDDFYIPDELKKDPNIRQFDGDYVQCNHCGKWLVQENWKIHIETRCSRLVRIACLPLSCKLIRVEEAAGQGRGAQDQRRVESGRDGCLG